MSDKKIPDGWEECDASVATHVFRPVDGTHLKARPATGALDAMVTGAFGEIRSFAWGVFGLTPIRKAPPPEPIEFVVADTTRYFGTRLVIVPDGVKPGMKFRQVVEE